MFFYSLYYNLKLRLLGCRVGRGLVVHGRLNLSIHPSAKVTIGDNVRLNSGWIVNSVGSGQSITITVGKNAKLQIGNHVGISNTIIVVEKEVIISDEVLIGGGAKIFDTDFHPTSADDRVLHRTKGVSQTVTLKKRCFIGSYATILKGVTVGEETIVGSGTIVTKDLPDKEIWAGFGSRRIR
jgi:acetyltransferase-like isoleucine patch superfamily enzyme